jgi:predicted glycogen debranching enzyme
MKTINNTIIEKLNGIENFTLRYDDGESVLWDINAPGLHVLLVAYHSLRFAGDRGKWSLLYHSYTGDFFKKAYDILNRAGLTEDFAPEIWGYIRKLNKYANAVSDPAIKASTNVQLFTFIQDFLENILYKEYVSRTNKRIADHLDAFKELLVAADSFVVRSPDGSIQIYAGYPWFDHGWGRDTFISMPGLLFVTERYEYAKSVFSFYARQQNKEGLLPNRILGPATRDYNTADGPLWFIEALHRYYLSAKSKDAENFVKRMITVVDKIMDCYTSPDGPIRLDADNLVSVPAQWTWMDAAPLGRPVTPRNGKPIEIQALFYNALGIASRFNASLGHKKLAQRYDALRAAVRVAINERFFPEGRAYPLDVIDGDPHIDAIRPNALFLVSLSGVDDLLSAERKKAIVETVERDLLTPYGVRSLAPFDSHYIGKYDTFAPMKVKDLAYHQGTVWPYLISHYAAAKKKIMADRSAGEVNAEIMRRAGGLIDYVLSHETLPEVCSGDEPYAAGGAVSQAWSVGALLEVFDLLNQNINRMRRA